jgi:GAF domain-containing protein
MTEPLRGALDALDQLLSGNAHEQAALDAVVVLMAKTLDVPLCKILVLVDDRSEFLVQAGVGWAPGVVGHARVSARPQSQPGYALALGQLVEFDDLSRTSRFTAADLARGHGIISSVCVPIKGTGAPLGVLCVHDVHPHHFSRSEQQFLYRAGERIGAFLARRPPEALEENPPEPST